MVTVMHLQATNRTKSMLRITTEKKRGKIFLSVEGRLAGPWVAALEQCWRGLHAASPREKFHVNLCGVSFLHSSGKMLLIEIHPHGAHLLPQVKAQISDEAQKVNLLAQFGGRTPFPGLPKTLGPYQVFSAGPSFGTPVFDLTLWRRYQAAQNTVDSSKASSLSTREQVILLVVSQYIGTLRGMANVQASQSRVDLAQALYDQAADLQKEGVGTGIDTLRANVELQNEKQRLIQAQTDRETSLFALSRLLNLDPRQAIELEDSLSFFDTPQPEVEPSIELALAERQEWKALESQIKAAEYQKKASQDSRLPSLRFDGNFAYVGTSGNTTLPTYTYQGSVNLPLFTGGKIRAEIGRADLKIKKLDQQKDDLRNQIELDVKTALLNLQSARNEVQVANLGVQLSKEEVVQARGRFKAGGATNTEA